ncbi:MAG: DEAD/DEAH box helicase [Eubacteriaceae bacterium]|nr:DEAD/DEAH box helicase [Eubacteriaceae bacterium]
MKNSFNDLGISPPILKAIEEMGFETPTEVQHKAIPHILKKKDLIVISKTGSGKTAVFGVPMLQMIDPSLPGPQGLILTPTRELAVQVDSDLIQMSKHIEHQTTAVYGQHNMSVEIRALGKGVSIVTGTPGRVHDHIRKGNLQTRHIRFLVIDEADRMLDMGFIDQVVGIIKTLPRDRITLLFSATIPAEIRRICREYMKDPVTIEIESQTKTVDAIQQVYYRVERNEKRTQLNRLLIVEQPESCMIFCNTRIAVDQVQSFLSQKGYACQALHGDIPQSKRLSTIQQFKRGEFHILVATDVAARGIHIDDLSLVINYDVPMDKDSYVHRIGRTGRAGHGGRAITFVTGDDIMGLYEIEEHIGALIAEEELPTEAVFKKRRAEADKWIQEKSHRKEPVKTSSSKEFTDKNKSRRKSQSTSKSKPSDKENRQRKPESKPVAVNLQKSSEIKGPEAGPAEVKKNYREITFQVKADPVKTSPEQSEVKLPLKENQQQVKKKRFMERIIKKILGDS